MENTIEEKVKKSIQVLRDKQARVYFLVQDTKGNAKASVRYIYQMAKTLKDNGFNPIMLHEKAEYSGVVAWMDEEYMSIPHKSIEGQNLEISPDDFIVVPEIFGFIMEQIKDLPCGKIVLTQNYSHIVETLQPGQSWAQYGFFKCLTTTKKQQEYIEKVMRQSSFDIVKPLITEAEQFVIVDADETDADIVNMCVDATDADLLAAGVSTSDGGKKRKKRKKCNAGKIKSAGSGKTIKYYGNPWP